MLIDNLNAKDFESNFLLRNPFFANVFNGRDTVIARDPVEVEYSIANKRRSETSVTTDWLCTERTYLDGR